MVDNLKFLTDDELINFIKNDDRASFNEIYRRYWQKLYLYSKNILNESELCEDILQEIFTDLWIRRHRLDIKNLSAFLYQGVKFQIFNHFRKSKNKKRLLEQLSDFQPDTDIHSDLESEELNFYYNQFISKLPHKQNLVYRLSREKELSNAEIANELGLSLQTVKNEISRAIKYIRDSIKKTYK
jgi:RNA polymerase sigma-70 factor (family 1)